LPHSEQAPCFPSPHMRILIVSDIHANLNALEAVLSDAGDFDSCWCLGDLVGYGPDPNECIARMRQIPELVCLLGNHDAAALNQIDIASFNPEARRALLWTQKILSQENAEYLKGRPERVDLDSVTLAHGSPRHPVWEYLLDTRTATLNFDFFQTPFCFVGHSHVPAIYKKRDDQALAELFLPEEPGCIEMVPRAIFNPGSVGQPRDRDPRASYAIYDDGENTWDYRRVAYDITEVQGRMQQVDLPERHIQRLSAGW
jgi:predicted phosphodiesterase